MFVKEAARCREKGQRQWLKSRLLKQMLRKQQIQQMNAPEEDNGIIIFFKLKHIFYDEAVDQEQIVAVIKEDPIREVDRILVTLTQEYSNKMDDLIEPIEEERNFLAARYSEVKERLQHSLDDNEYFKAMIDRLQQQKKDVQLKLNQSQDQIERSKDEMFYQNFQRQKIKHEAIKLFQDYQQKLTQNSQMKETILNYQRENNTLKEMLQKLKSTNLKLTSLKNELSNKCEKMQLQSVKVMEENDYLKERISQKQQFIASFVDQYNKFHLFKQEDSPDFKNIVTQSKNQSDEEKDQLRGFNFSQYDKQSIISQKSASKKSSNHGNQQEIDERFIPINATAQKSRCPRPYKNVNCSEQKRNSRVQIIDTSKNVKKIVINSKNTSNMKSQMSKKEKGLIKTVSTSNLRSKQPANLQTPSDNNNEDQKEIIQSMLRKKLNQKNQKISKLQIQIMSLKNQCIEQRQSITEMEGGYQLQIQQLRSELSFIKLQMNEFYQKHTLIKLQEETQREKVNELQNILQNIKEEHQVYCLELKNRCKAYVINKIDQVQQKYQELKHKLINQHQSSEHSQIQSQKQYISQQYEDVSQDNLQISQSVDLHNIQDQQISLQLDRRDLQDSPSQSYQHISNHYMNGQGIDMDFSSHKNTGFEMVQEIYIRQNFQIQSDLGCFTERLKEQSNKFQKVGNFTDRSLKEYNYIQSRFQQNQAKPNKLSLCCQVFQDVILPHRLQMSIIQYQNIHFASQKKQFCINKVCEQSFSSTLQQTFSVTNQFSLNIYEPKTKQLQIKSKFMEFAKEGKRKIKLTSNRIMAIQMQIQKLKTLKIYSNNIQQIINPTKNTENLAFNKQYQLSIFPIKVDTAEKNIETQQQQQISQLFSMSFTNNFHKKLKLFSHSLQIVINNQIHSQISQIQREDASQQSDIPQKKLSLVKVTSFTLNSSMSTASPILQKGTPSTDDKIIHVQQFHELQNQSNHSSLKEICEQSELVLGQKDQNQRSPFRISNWAVVNQDQDIQVMVDNSTLNLIKIIQHSDNKQNDKIFQSIESQRKSIEKDVLNKKTVIEQSPSYSQTVNHLHNSSESLLNKALIFSQQNQKQETSYRNPQSKSTKARRVEPSQITISPWFFDDKKQIQINHNIVNIQIIPQQIIYCLNRRQIAQLSKYLKKHSLTLHYQKKVENGHFIRPNQLQRKLYIFLTTNNETYSQETFVLSRSRIQCLQTDNFVKFEKNVFIDQNNFMFGQSEVQVTGDGELIVRREGKKYKMSGTLNDGDWTINCYIMCKYHVVTK